MLGAQGGGEHAWNHCLSLKDSPWGRCRPQGHRSGKHSGQVTMFFFFFFHMHFLTPLVEGHTLFEKKVLFL